MKISSHYKYYKQNSYINKNFGALKFKTDEKGVKTPENLTIQTNIGEVKVVSEPQLSHEEHIFYLDNYKLNFNQGKPVKGLGRESLSINLGGKFINGNRIDVNDDYQKKHKFGEILRLVSVIEMMENNLDSICIQSMPEAVIFHGKYKFVPDHDEFSVEEMLESISKNEATELIDCKNEAQDILKRIKHYGLWKDNGVNLKQTNELTQKYIDIIIKNRIPSGPKDFGEGFGMELTRERVIENKDFFNSLFEKHGMDYEI